MAGLGGARQEGESPKMLMGRLILLDRKAGIRSPTYKKCVITEMYLLTTQTVRSCDYLYYLCKKRINCTT
jgi:hypothetical protein